MLGTKTKHLHSGTPPGGRSLPQWPWGGQSPVLATLHKKPDQNRQAQDGGWHDRKTLTELEELPISSCIQVMNNPPSPPHPPLTTKSHGTNSVLGTWACLQLPTHHLVILSKLCLLRPFGLLARFFPVRRLKTEAVPLQGGTYPPCSPWYPSMWPYLEKQSLRHS